jgi:predicted kinase
MIGAPGSGKSFIARLIRECEKAFYVCPDYIRERQPEADHRQVFRLAYQQLYQALRRGQSVILDATSAQRAHREDAIRFAHKNGAMVIGIFVRTPLPLCLERHAERLVLRSQVTLTPEVIRRYCAQLELEPPRKSQTETYDELVVITPTDDPISLLNLFPPV